MAMTVLEVSVARAAEIEHEGRVIQTGIFKQPVSGPVRVTSLGLEGDEQADLVNHGGRDKAVYVYSYENYGFWEKELRCSVLPFGQFGENLTVSAMPDEAVHIGDVFGIGSALLEVTQPRVPCFKLGIKMGDAHFVERFLRSGRVGFYLRVLREGTVSAGDRIQRMSEHPERLSVRDAMRARLKGPQQAVFIERALSIDALSESWRRDLGKRRAG